MGSINYQYNVFLDVYKWQDVQSTNEALVQVCCSLPNIDFFQWMFFLLLEKNPLSNVVELSSLIVL